MAGTTIVPVGGQPALDPQQALIAARLQALEWRMSRIEVGVGMALAQLGLTIPNIPFPGTAAAKAPPAPAAPAAPVTKEGPYNYHPLASGKSEVRILKLIGGTESEPIECSLLHIDLDRAGQAKPGDADFSPLSQFVALSYTWGEPKFDQSILLDGHQFPVTKNLKQALLRLRTTPMPGINLPYKAVQPQVSYWWIDAICINQADLDERASQVLLARQIYHKAHNVHVWLGEEADESNRAFEIVAALDKPLPFRGPGVPEPEPLIVEDNERRTNWAALATLLSRPWWHRVWVRQEIALNNRIMVRCGGAACFFHTLAKVSKTVSLLKLQTGYDPDLRAATSPKSPPSIWYAPIEELSALQNETFYGRQYSDLSQLILHGRTCQATDLRDKVFALLGLADPKVHGLVPNYRLPLRQVIIDAAKAVISKTSKLDLLAAAQNPTRQNGLPSWVPNVVDEWKAWPLPEKDGWSPTMKTTAPTIEFAGVEGSESLTLQGFRCDTISLLSEDVVRANDSTDTLQSTYVSWKAFSRDPEYTRKHFGAYENSMKHGFLSARNDREWLEFVSIRTDTQWFEYAQDDSFIGPKKETNFMKQEKDDRPKTYFVPSEFHDSAAHPFARIHASMRKHAAGRRLGFVTNGCLGLFPGDVQVGDLVVGIPGAFHPLILREEGDAFVLVGQACELRQDPVPQLVGLRVLTCNTVIVFQSHCMTWPSKANEKFKLV